MATVLLFFYFCFTDVVRKILFIFNLKCTENTFEGGNNGGGETVRGDRMRQKGIRCWGGGGGRRERGTERDRVVGNKWGVGWGGGG